MSLQLLCILIVWCCLLTSFSTAVVKYGVDISGSRDDKKCNNKLKLWISLNSYSLLFTVYWENLMKENFDKLAKLGEIVKIKTHNM